MVTARVGRFLVDAPEVMGELGRSLSSGDQQRLITSAKGLAEQWLQLGTVDRRAMLISVSANVIVSEQGIRITLRRDALRYVLLDTEPTHRVAGPAPDPITMSEREDRLLLNSPARLKLCSGEMRLVIPPAHAREMPPRPNASLIKALVRAHKCKEKLFSGEVPSVRAIAEQEGLTERPVARILRLAFLAPDITESILDGCQPADLELQRLLQGIPLGWDEQRKLLGIKARD